jgi:Tol biopolymer transport system component
MAIFVLAMNFIAPSISSAVASPRVYYINKKDALCSINIDGTDEKCYGKSHTTLFSFSPDGKYVAFQGEGNSITLIDTKSHKKHVLVKDNKDKYSIEWSPDARSIAYVIADEDTNEDGKIDRLDKFSIGIVSVGRGEVFVPAKSGADSSSMLFWSKDGKHVYYSRHSGARHVPMQQLLRADRLSGEKSIIAERADHIMSDLGCGALHINQHNSSDQEPRYSDMLVGSDRYVYSSKGEIFLKDREKRKVRKLAEHTDYDPKYYPGYYNPRWATRTKILFVGKKAIYLFEAGKKRKEKLVKGGSPGLFIMPSKFKVKALTPVSDGGACSIAKEN